MCRSIVRLRDGSDVFDREAMEAAALQYVRKVSGFRAPSPANAEVFARGVAEVAGATERLMEDLRIRSQAARPVSRPGTDGHQTAESGPAGGTGGKGAGR